MTTIKEIAEIAGVSTTTVSNVIHGKIKKVSPQNVERIKKLLEEHQYVTPMQGSYLTNKSSKMIGVVILSGRRYQESVIANSFYARIVGALEKNIREAGYYMMLYSSDIIEDIFRMAVGWGVDGLIVVSFPYKDYKKLGNLIQKPIVGIDLRNVEDDQGYHIGIDDENGGYMMTKYLLEQGRRKIKFLLNENVGVDHLRWKGYRRALEERKIIYKDSDLIFISNYRDKRRTEYKNLFRFLNQDVTLFFAADYYAIEAISYLQNNGVKIPEQISVVGYDDEEYAGMICPGLTTVRQEVEQKGEEAFQMLLKLLHGEPVEENYILLPVRLRVRQSVRE